MGIKGNEHADLEAKTIANNNNQEIVYFQPTKNDFSKYMTANWKNKIKPDWAQYNHYYSFINPKREQAIYPTATKPAMNEAVK